MILMLVKKERKGQVVCFLVQSLLVATLLAVLEGTYKLGMYGEGARLKCKRNNIYDTGCSKANRRQMSIHLSSIYLSI